MMIHILLVQTLQLQLQSVLICLVNVTLTAKTSLHTSQFERPMAAAVYHTVVGLEKIWQRTENRQTENREQKTEKPITEATLLPYGWNAGLSWPIYSILFIK